MCPTIMQRYAGKTMRVNSCHAQHPAGFIFVGSSELPFFGTNEAATGPLEAFSELVFMVLGRKWTGRIVAI
ncbi:hypothetical protein D9615_001676 [Tricholomella constricta]|uniref:Uncharacterized protein n=1 Tax=Tricholomella constricta TaxID=117010 RepID=A0A8H5HPG5_9AGAR|nr:hypothetical protein D9615_001676 [Tricholomella constricta]